MAPVRTSVTQLVNENSAEDFLKASEILLKFVNNILNSPNEPKYRRIRLANPVVESKLLPVSGAMECLFEMGFEEDGDFLTLPRSAPLSVLSGMKSQMDNERAVIQRSRPQTSPLGQSGGAAGSQATRSAAGSGSGTSWQGTAQNSRELMVKEPTFFRKLEAQMSHVLIYEDAQIQQKARETIPVIQLTEEAKQKLELLNQSENSGGPTLDVRDCLVLSLLNWFKTSFFKWVDAPACRSCGGKTSMQGMVEPTAEELRWAGNRVENYKCTTCGVFTRFVRYNNPGKLLDTREGRCGEWANCFTLCCRALGFEARYVLDWTDHVWTEVYSDSQQRWVHCDPCENACDKPLLYEVGWGKKLSYIIAFSKDDIEDVTWRYSADYKGLLSRRQECRESWLVSTLFNLDQKMWNAMPEAKKNTRLHRKIVDLVEFMTEKSADGQNLSVGNKKPQKSFGTDMDQSVKHKVNVNECYIASLYVNPYHANHDKSGFCDQREPRSDSRITGSLEWRVSRGELGNQAKTEAAEPYVFKLTEGETQSKCFHITYSCARDEYVRVSDGSSQTSGYQALVHKQEKVFRKVEHDWKMSYLARVEGSDSAEIAWKCDFKGNGLLIDRVEVKLDCSTYENGKISWLMCSDETCAMLKNGPMIQPVSDLEGQTGFTLTASLSGGKGNVSWQHTQLFRQTLDDQATSPFEIKVYFK